MRDAWRGLRPAGLSLCLRALIDGLGKVVLDQLRRVVAVAVETVGAVGDDETQLDGVTVNRDSGGQTGQGSAKAVASSSSVKGVYDFLDVWTRF